MRNEDAIICALFSFSNPKLERFWSDVKLLRDDLLIQKLVYLLYIPIDSKVLLPDNIRTIVANAIEYQKAMILDRITRFSVKNTIVEIKQKIFTGRIKLTELEIQETLSIALEFDAKYTSFFNHLAAIW